MRSNTRARTMAARSARNNTSTMGEGRSATYQKETTKPKAASSAKAFQWNWPVGTLQTRYGAIALTATVSGSRQPVSRARRFSRTGSNPGTRYNKYSIRNAAMMGPAAQRGMLFWRAYRKPAALNPIQPVSRAARKAPSVWCIGIILALGQPAALRGEEPPPDLVRRVAHVETETQQARSHYTYRQSVTLEELSERGMKVGEYHEVRDIIFSPAGERTEQMVGHPFETLKNLKL